MGRNHLNKFMGWFHKGKGDHREYVTPARGANRIACQTVFLHQGVIQQILKRETHHAIES
jgi:hypothetical protein